MPDILDVGIEMGYTRQQVALLLEKYPGVFKRPSELAEFLYQAKRMQLDPLLNECYPLRMGEAVQMVVSINVLRARTADLMDGYSGPEYMYQDGKLIGAKGHIWRRGCTHPISTTVFLAEYDRGNRMWREKPHLMLAKVLEAALRRLAFGDRIAGMYVAEELGAMEDTIEAGGSNGAPVTDVVASPKSEDRSTSEHDSEAEERKPDTQADTASVRDEELRKRWKEAVAWLAAACGMTQKEAADYAKRFASGYTFGERDPEKWIQAVESLVSGIQHGYWSVEQVKSSDPKAFGESLGQFDQES